MNAKVSLILSIPSLFLILFRLYLRFRFTRSSYLRRFHRTLISNLSDQKARDEIYRFQKEITRGGFMEIIKAFSS